MQRKERGTPQRFCEICNFVANQKKRFDHKSSFSSALASWELTPRGLRPYGGGGGGESGRPVNTYTGTSTARALTDRPHPTPGTRRLEQDDPRLQSRRAPPGPRSPAPASLRRGTGTRGGRCRRPATETCPGAVPGKRGCPARSPGLPPGPTAPPPSRLPTPSRGPQSPRAKSRDGAGRAAPPRRSRAPAAAPAGGGRAPPRRRSGPAGRPTERPHLPTGFLRAAGRLVRHLASPLAQPWR